MTLDDMQANRDGRAHSGDASARPRRVFVGNLPYGNPHDVESSRSAPAKAAPQGGPPALPDVDYDGLAAECQDGHGHIDPAALVNALVAAASEAYADAVDVGEDLLEFEVDGFTYVFDFSSGSKRSEGRVTEDRVVAAWGRSRRPQASRDGSRMRGFPSPDRPDSSARTHRGHLFGHAMGGGLDVNLFPQDAALNTGRSEEGRRFRAMERYAEGHPGTLCFIRLLYGDETWRPLEIEYVLLIEEASRDRLWVDRFRN